MKHANIDLLVFDDPGFSEASNEQVGLWLIIYAYCARQENNGLINAAGAWSDAHCQRLFRCNQADLHSSPLWEMRPNGQLNLLHYNTRFEDWCKKARKTHARAIHSRSEAKQAAARRNGRQGAKHGKKGGRPCKIIDLPLQVNS